MPIFLMHQYYGGGRFRKFRNSNCRAITVSTRNVILTQKLPPSTSIKVGREIIMKNGEMLCHLCGISFC